MRNFIIIISFILLSTIIIQAQGELEFKPEAPEEFDLVTFKYVPPEDLQEAENFKLFLYSFRANKSNPEAYEMELVRNPETGKYTGKMRLPDFTVFALLKIYTELDGEVIYDDNRNRMWDIIVYSEPGKPLEKAYLKAALSYMGSLPGNLKRITDFNKALNYLEKEVELYPDNIQTQIGYTSLLFDLRKISPQNYRERIEKITEQDYNPKSEDAVRALSRGLKSVNKTDEAETLEKRFAKENPESELAKEFVLAYLSKANSLREFTDISKTFLDNYEESRSRERIFSALISAYLQIGRYQELVEFISQYDNIPEKTYIEIAVRLLEDRDSMKGGDEADRLNEALLLMQTLSNKIDSTGYFERSLSDKPDYMTKTEWEIDRRLLKGSVNELMGDIYAEMGQNDLAVNHYKMAIEQQKEMTTDVLYENLISITNNLSLDTLSYNLAKEAILNSKASEYTIKMYKKYYKILGHEEQKEYETALDSLKDIAYQKRISELERNMLELPFKSGVFETLDERVVDLEYLRGKVVVLIYWATWCGPCQVMFPAIDNLNSVYKDNPDVVIGAVNVWEDASRDRDNVIYDFLSDDPTSFPIFIDRSDIVPKKMGVTGLPTTVIIDKEGKIQFKMQGFSSEENFVEKSVDRIDLLLSKEK